MKENFIKSVQKFVNAPFRHPELISMLDKQKDFLLQESILEKTEYCEYNALWDVICYLEDYFKFAHDKNVCIGAQISKKK